MPYEGSLRQKAGFAEYNALGKVVRMVTSVYEYGCVDFACGRNRATASVMFWLLTPYLNDLHIQVDPIVVDGLPSEFRFEDRYTLRPVHPSDNPLFHFSANEMWSVIESFDILFRKSLYTFNFLPFSTMDNMGSKLEKLEKIEEANDALVGV